MSFVSLVYTCSLPGQHFGCGHLCCTAVFDTSCVTMHFSIADCRFVQCKLCAAAWCQILQVRPVKWVCAGFADMRRRNVAAYHAAVFQSGAAPRESARRSSYSDLPGKSPKRTISVLQTHGRQTGKHSVAAVMNHIVLAVEDTAVDLICASSQICY